MTKTKILEHIVSTLNFDTPIKDIRVGMFHTAEDLLNLCSHDAFVVMLGDTTPISPILFDYEIDAISGTITIDPELAMQCVSQGANFRQIKGTKRLTMMRI